MTRTYAMDKQRASRRKTIVVVILGVLLLEYMAIRTAERVGFARGYVYGLETIID